MYKKIFLGISMLSLSLSAQEKKEGIYANIDTNKGTIIIELTYEQTPITVANFISLAEGDNKAVDKKFKKKNFYDGLTFHRVIKDFMIQGGDPEGKGSGGPGYTFADEIVEELKHDKAGTLSMANRGPETNGSQFFITHKATPWLDGKHTVFGYVTEGINVVNDIKQNDKINTITFEYIGRDANKFNASKVFAKHMKERKKLEQEKKNKAKENAKIFNEARQQAYETEEGVKIFVTEKGTGEKPTNGAQLLIDYSAYLENGTLFDSSIAQIAEENFALNLAKKQSGGYQPLTYIAGGKQNMIKGFSIGIEELNYGDKALLFIPAKLGYGKKAVGSIPANSDLIFEIQIIKK